MRSGTGVLGVCVVLAAVACGGTSTTDGNGGGGAGGALSLGGAAHAGTSPGSAGAGIGGGTSHGGGAGASSAGAASNAGASSAGAGGSSNSGGAAGIGPVDQTDYGSGACKAFDPCGGSVVGTWTIDGLCADPTLQGIAALCPATQETYEVSGSLTFNEDGRVSSVFGLTFHDLVPTSCLASLGGCGAPNGVLAGCSPNADGSCKCDSPSTVTPPVDQHYSVSGNQLFLSQTDQPPSVLFYCRSGTQLLMRGKSGGRIFEYSLSHQ